MASNSLLVDQYRSEPDDHYPDSMTVRSCLRDDAKMSSPRFGRRLSTAIFGRKDRFKVEDDASFTPNDEYILPTANGKSTVLRSQPNYRRHSASSVSQQSSDDKEHPHVKLGALPKMCRRLSEAVFQGKHHSKAGDEEGVFAKDQLLVPNMFPAKSFDFTFKVLLIGDSGVGKTSLLMRMRRDLFVRSLPSTVGIDYKDKEIVVDDSKVKLRIWDTAGTEKFRSISRNYFRDADALLLVYDVTNERSFCNMLMWLDEVKENAPDDAIIMLIGNKCDVCETEKEVGRRRGVKLAKEFGAKFTETSAKDGQNVELALQTLARTLIAAEFDSSSSSGTSLFSSSDINSHCKWSNCEGA